MNTVYKSASEAAALLKERYDGPMKGVQGRGGKTYDYIPWNESARQLDKVFGIFGWDSKVTALSAHPAEGVYTAAVEVTARVLDDETGNVITITRSAVGRGTAQPSKDEREKLGLTISQDLGTHDTAAATAGSDAFSRACKLLGDAFGLFLYDKPETASYTRAAAQSAGSRTQAPRQAPAGQAGTGQGPRPSVKQMTVLNERGYTTEQVEGMDFRDWKGVLDAIFGKYQPEIAPEGEPQERGNGGTVRGKPAAVGQAVSQDDDIPF